MSWAAVNPILERELRARFRGRRSFLMLTLFVLVEIGVFVLLFASSVLQDAAPVPAAQLGRRSVLDDATLLQHDDAVELPHRR